MGSQFIKIHESDNVATALVELPAGTLLVLSELPENTEIEVIDKITFGHKFAVADIPPGGDVVKYGAVIGCASQAIRKGQHVHVHNTKSNRGRGDLPENKTKGSPS